MKNNLKENKAITLVALIITIIVLLILAVVTITAVSEGNIFNHANNAATRYNAAATEENALLSNLLSDMEKYASTKTKTWEERGITNVDLETLYINTENGMQVILYKNGGMADNIDSETGNLELTSSSALDTMEKNGQVKFESNKILIWEDDNWEIAWEFNGDTIVLSETYIFTKSES